MPSPFSDKNALYLLTILEAIEKIKIYSNGFDTPELLFAKLYEDAILSAGRLQTSQVFLKELLLK